jgi:hypothetical protein
VDSLERLKKNLFPLPFASYGKINGNFSGIYKIPVGLAIDFPILQINSSRCIRYLCFDIDRPDAQYAWEKAKLPEPTFICVNPKNKHAHIIYELTNPVWLRKSNDFRPGEAPPVKYLRSVYKAMRDALKADPSYTGLTVKNPLSGMWIVHKNNYTFTLGELAKNLNLSVPKASLIKNFYGRNCSLFDSIRKWSYRSKKQFDNYNLFYECLKDELERLNDKLTNRLSINEINHIGKSVAKWTWNTYNGNGKDSKRRGIMNLNGTLPIEVRQSLGQKFTSEIRRNNTLSKIFNTVNSFKKTGTKISKSSLSKATGLSYKTITHYWNEVKISVRLNDSVKDASSLSSLPDRSPARLTAGLLSSSLSSLPDRSPARLTAGLLSGLLSSLPDRSPARLTAGLLSGLLSSLPDRSLARLFPNTLIPTQLPKKRRRLRLSG